MKPCRGPRLIRLWKGVLWLAALDGAVTGAWALLRPTDLFGLLQYPAHADGLLLCRVLALLFLANTGFLGAAAIRPVAYGGLTLAPLFGRALSAGVWLWLLGSGRMPESYRPLWALLAHDAAWALLFTAFLVARWKHGPPPAPTRPVTPPVPPA